jgi:hypothetical protein
MCTGILLRPTSKKQVIAKIVVKITHVQVINTSLKFSELIRIKNVIANSIISIEISIRIIFFLLVTKPKIPIKNNTKDKIIKRIFFI